MSIAERIIERARPTIAKEAVEGARPRIIEEARPLIAKEAVEGARPLIAKEAVEGAKPGLLLEGKKQTLARLLKKKGLWQKHGKALQSVRTLEEWDRIEAKIMDDL